MCVDVQQNGLFKLSLLPVFSSTLVMTNVIHKKQKQERKLKAKTHQ